MTEAKPTQAMATMFGSFVWFCWNNNLGGEGKRRRTTRGDIQSLRPLLMVTNDPYIDFDIWENGRREKH
jgi:hypothetical protein